MDETLTGFYYLYHERVNAPYSLGEERLLAKIAKQITSQLTVSKKCESIPPAVMRVEEGCFRFVLPEQNLFSSTARLQCLLQFDEFLTAFFADYGNDVAPFSYEECAILKRIKKLFVHQLKGTSQYAMFKKKCPPPGSRLSEQEKLELLNQQKDERRLKAACNNIVRYNPLSEKYKALKAETLRKIEQQD